MLEAPGQLQTDHQLRGSRLAMNIMAETDHASEFKKKPGCATMFQRHYLSATIPIDLCGQPVGPASKLDQRKILLPRNLQLRLDVLGQRIQRNVFQSMLNFTLQARSD